MSAMNPRGGMPASEPVGIVGFGHFGRALTDVSIEAGIEVRTWDPNVAVASDVAASSLEDLAGHAAILIVATPVRSIRDAVRHLKPMLLDHHLVIDVGSVKVQPGRWMAEELGGDFSWVGTHPLFGPTNIARGERPLRAVVCPNRFHPDATDRARRFYESIGCRVITQEAEEHDRLMARTHAIAFFIAKGLIDVGTGDDVPFTPPSFQALAQTIDSVRSDAGHLYLAIERDNPFAADARQSLLDALTRVHTLLETMDDGAPTEGAQQALAIPDMGGQAPELMETRDLIDEVDTEIVRLLVRRSHLAQRAGRIKSATGRGVRDRAREQELLEQRMALASAHGLSEESVADVFSAILRFSRAVQSD